MFKSSRFHISSEYKLAMTRQKKIIIVFLFHMTLANVVLSQLTVAPLQQFHLHVSCFDPKHVPAFNSKVLHVCLTKTNSGRACSEIQEEMGSSEGDSSDTGSNDDNDDLYQQLVESMSQKICQNESAFQQLRKNRTSTNLMRRDLSFAPPAAEVQVANTDEDDLQSTIRNLRLGIVLGTVLGFLGGVFTTGVIITVYTKKVLRHKTRRNTSHQEIKTTEHSGLGREDGKYDIVNYTYRDVNSETCNRSDEPFSLNPNTTEWSVHKYEDCSLNTYSHLKKDASDDCILNAEYDHIRKACADGHLATGEYRVLEPRGSGQESGFLPTKKPNEDTHKTSENSYFKLENPTVETSDPGAYFVLQKEN